MHCRDNNNIKITKKIYYKHFGDFLKRFQILK